MVARRTLRWILSIGVIAWPVGSVAAPPDLGSDASDAAEAEVEAEPKAEAPTDGTPQEGGDGTPTVQAEGSASPVSIEVFDTRRRDLVALFDGTLDAKVDVDALLSVSLTDDPLLDAEDLSRLIEVMRRAREEPLPRPEDVERPSADLAEAKARWMEALAAFSALDPELRRTRLDAHQEAHEARESARAALQARLDRARTTRTNLEAFLAGTLDLEVDPVPLLRIDLLDPPSNSEDPDALEREVVQAEDELAQTRRSLLERPLEERRALLDLHRKRLEPEPEPEPEPGPEVESEVPDLEAEVAAAEEDAVAIAAQRELALAQARAARSEAIRQLEEERARLLGVKEAQARFEVELTESRARAAEHHEATQTWEGRVDAVVEAVEAFTEPAEDPDGMYPRLREELGQARSRLADVLGRLPAGATDVPKPGTLAELSDEIDAAPLLELHRELTVASEELIAQEHEVRWILADGYRDDIVRLNQARLQLLGTTSPSLRDSMTGFGPDGVRQVRGELEQIGLELRYRGSSLPRHLMALVDDLRTSPVPLLLGLLQLVVLVLGFRWWRRRAPALLDAAQRSSDGGRIRRSGVSTAAWYLARIRKPLEWLVLGALIFYGSSAAEAFPELELLWLIVLWLMVGSASILLVDAIAARENRRQGGASAMAVVRIRSLRLIGLSVTYTGLVLSLADAFVGEGAIYAWVLGTCWLLAIPIALLLTHWWKGYIFTAFESESEAESEGRIATWVRERTTGWASYPTAMAGGLFLVMRGTWRWLLLRAARFEGTRHLLAYFFRKQVARQAEVTGRAETVEPADAELRARFVEPLGDDALLDGVALESLDRVRRAIERPGSTFCLVVAERGRGKSTLLRRLHRDHEGPSLALSCPASGLEGLLANVARTLKLPPDSSLEAVAEALREGGPCLVTVDDIQRLMQPTIGGMRGLDELGRLTRLAGPDVSWIATIGAAAWQYVERARGDRLHFSDIIALGPWDEESISDLMRRRCELLEVSPSFESLVIPRQYDDDELEAGKRREIGYYRILWDYAGGNPHVASWFWAESLFRDADGDLVVRLFREPPAAELDALSLPLQFVLRALVQLETASRSELSDAIRMSADEIQDALSYAIGRGYVSEENGIFALTWPWYRAVTRMLQRQHLLAA